MHIHVVHHILVNTSIYTLSRISRIGSTWRSNFNFKEVLFTKKGQEFRKKIGSAILCINLLVISRMLISQSKSTDTTDIANIIQIFYTRATCASYAWVGLAWRFPPWLVSHPPVTPTCTRPDHWSPGNTFCPTVVCSSSLVVYWITQTISPCLFTFSTHKYTVRKNKDGEPFCFTALTDTCDILSRVSTFELYT